MFYKPNKNGDENYKSKVGIINVKGGKSERTDVQHMSFSYLVTRQTLENKDKKMLI